MNISETWTLKWKLHSTFYHSEPWWKHYHTDFNDYLRAILNEIIYVLVKIYIFTCLDHDFMHIKFHISMHKIFDNMLTDGLKFRGEEKEGRDDVIRREIRSSSTVRIPLYKHEARVKEKRLTFVNPCQQSYAQPRTPPVCFAYSPWKDLLILLPVTNTETMTE